MRRVLAAAVLVAFMPTANAQDKGKADFSSNAEFRARFFYMQNPGGNENTKSSARMGESRFKMGVNYKANEKVSAHATLLHNAGFGQETNGNAVINTQDPAQEDDMVTVNEAYGVWRSSEDLAFKVGRFNWQIADGALVGTNDWEANPYSFEGLASIWEQEFGTFTFAAVKLRELDSSTRASSSGDPEHNLYGINFDLKSKPEMLKTLNVHVLKNNSDALESTGAVNGKMATSTDGFDTIRYGTMAGLAFGPVDVNLWYELQGGKVKHMAAAPAYTITEWDYKGNMMQAEVAYNMPSLMSSRFHLMYHKDSGDSSSTDKELGTYDSYATEKHNSAGAMDLFGWGNLTFIQLGWKAKPMDKTDVGFQFTMFSLTENDTAGAPGFTQGTYGGDLAGAATKADADKLGNEIDLWATHQYDANLSNTLRLGYFMPGDRFDTTTAPSTDKILHVMIEGKATF